MNIYNLIEYEAGINVPQLVNKYLTAEYANQEHEYLIFSQSDILAIAKDKNELCNTYINFMNAWKVPFTFYCYYGRFNSVLPDSANHPNPRLVVKTEKGKADLISQLAYGFLVLNVSMLKSKNIKLDESYPAIFYLQELAEQCYRTKLWLSNCCFFDVHESWKLFKEHKNNGYNIDIKAFNEEKERYNKQNIEYKDIREFLEIYKASIHPIQNNVAVTSSESGITNTTNLSINGINPEKTITINTPIQGN
jgi:hypothetical protein